MDALADLDADMGEVTRVLMEIKDEGQKEEDKRSVVDILSDSSLTDNQKAEIFRSTASESKEAKLNLAEEYGVSGGEWIAAEEAFSQELEDRGADSMSQAIAAAAIRTMDGLDRQERATLELEEQPLRQADRPGDLRAAACGGMRKAPGDHSLGASFSRNGQERHLAVNRFCSFSSALSMRRSISSS